MSKQRYRAVLNGHGGSTNGCSIFTWKGTVTPCGQWVEHGPTRWRLDDGTWHETEEAAEASLADEIEAIALACNKQARRLRMAADEVRQGAAT
jgi:hypothetical protein